VKYPLASFRLSPDETRLFYRNLFRLAVPMALQSFLMFSLNMIDTLMIGQLGETEIASVALGNQVFFVLLLFFYGITTGTAVFTAQYWGKKDIPGIRRAMGLCIATAAGGAVLVTLLSFLRPAWILAVFSTDPRVIDLGSDYLKIVCLSYILSAVSMSFAMVLRSVEMPKIPLLVTFISLILNTALNYLLIFGKLGFPAMGVRGAALATAISRAVEFAVLLAVVYRMKTPLAGRMKDFVDISAAFARRYFRITIPVVLNEVGWALGFTMYKIVFARMGTDVIAAVNIAENVTNLLLVVFHGTSNACAVMIGNLLGAGEEKKAYNYAVRFSLLGPFLGVAVGLVLVVVSGWVPLLFRVDQSVRDITRTILILHALFTPFDVFNWQLIVGILRSGGDTRFSMLMEIGTMWGYGVPLAFIAGLLLHEPAAVVFFLVRSEEIVKFAVGIFRLLSKKWICNLTDEGQ
jgi:putative MATE family efflux protein